MNCEICNKKLVLFVKLLKFDLLRCVDCDHIISNLKINKKYLKKTYSKNYLMQKHKNWMNNPNNEFYKKIENFILDNNIKKILDLGEMIEKPYKKVSIELSNNYDLDELKEALKEEGATQINIIVKEKDKSFAFKLEKTRKFDLSIFNNVKSKEYVKKISF